MIKTKYIFLSTSICYFLLFGQNTEGMIVPAGKNIISASAMPTVLTATPKYSTSVYNKHDATRSKSTNSGKYGHLIDAFPLYTINTTTNCKLFEDVQKMMQKPFVLNKAIQWFNTKRSDFKQLLDYIKNSKTVVLHHPYQSQELQIQLYYALTYVAYQYFHAHTTKQALSSNITNTKKQKNSTKQDRSEKKLCKKEQENAISSELKSEDKPELEKNNLENSPTNDQILLENEILKEQIEDLKKKLAKINNLLKNKDEDLNNLKIRYGQNNKALRDVINLKDVDIDKKNKEIDIINQEKNVLSTQTQVQENILHTLTEENKALHMEKRNLIATQQKLLTEKINLEQKIENLEEEKKTHYEELNSQQNIIDTLEEEKKRLSQELLDGKQLLEESHAKLLVMQKEYEETKTNLLQKIGLLEKNIANITKESEQEENKNKSLQLENNELHTIVKNLKENLDLIKKDQENITQLLHCITECMEEDAKERKEDLADAQQKTEATVKAIFSKQIKAIKKETQEVNASLEAIAKIFEEDVSIAQKDTTKIQKKYDLTKYLLYLTVLALILQTTYVYNQNSTAA